MLNTFEPMHQEVSLISLLVSDYDEAIAFYTGKLHFILKEDTRLSDEKRWVVVTPPGSSGCGILLAKAANGEQQSRIGNQTGGRVFLFLRTNDFDRDYQALLDNDITIVREPTVEPYGKVAVFADLYGNLWDMIGPLY
jgi:catechol 2,3-dioxygenase-like lactoylglutathione lyase family enzyme